MVGSAWTIHKLETRIISHLLDGFERDDIKFLSLLRQRLSLKLNHYSLEGKAVLPKSESLTQFAIQSR